MKKSPCGSAGTSAEGRVTRITPSAPTPNRRSHSAATSREDRGRLPSRSSSMTKSLPVPWYFQIRSSVTLEVLRHLVHNADRPALTAGEPPDPGVSSEPDHLADARLDTTGQDVPWNVDPRGPNAFIRVALPSHRVARERAPGDRGHLECPNRPSDVARLDPDGGGRIELRKALVQAIRSENLGLGPKLVAGFRVRRRKLELIDDGPEVQAGAADQQDPAASRIDALHDGPGELLVPSYREWLLGLGHVHQVMRDPRSLRRGRLGRPNVHPPVHEHRVHRDDLGPQPPREGQGGLALSGGGRSNEREERLRAGHQRAAAGSRDEPAAADPLAPTTSPARWCGWAAAIRTSRNVPGAIVPGTWTTLLVRVRPWTPPFRPIPSTRTSNVRPIVSRIRSSEIDSCTWTSRSNRSWTTSLGIWFGIVAASVPGRGEYWNVYAWSNRAAPTTSSVPRKSSSVSPGKPTMMSVVTATPWMASRIRFSHERYRSLR